MEGYCFFYRFFGVQLYADRVWVSVLQNRISVCNSSVGLGRSFIPTQPMMAKPAIADTTIHSARQNKVIRDKPETKGFILS